MKIISQIPKERYLVSLSGEEMANLLGLYSKFDIKKDFLDDVISTERDIDLSSIYKRYYALKTILRSGECEAARKEVQKIIEALSLIEPILNNLNENNS